jgi:hypothetical protein
MGRVRRLCFAAAFLPVLAGHAPADGLDRVLLLHSIGPYFSPWSSISPRFREQLSKRNGVDIYEASLQGERIREAPEENSPRALWAGACPPGQPAEVGRLPLFE